MIGQVHFQAGPVQDERRVPEDPASAGARGPLSDDDRARPVLKLRREEVGGGTGSPVYRYEERAVVGTTLEDTQLDCSITSL